MTAQSYKDYSLQSTAGLWACPSLIYSDLAGLGWEVLQLPKPDTKQAKRRETYPVTQAQDCPLRLGSCNWGLAQGRRGRRADPPSLGLWSFRW